VLCGLTFELTGRQWRGALAAKSPRCRAVGGPVERGVRQRCISGAPLEGLGARRVVDAARN